jgi:hypothetical protein
MIIDTCSFNQTQSTRDKDTLSGQMPANTIKNTSIFTSFRNENSIDETPCLIRHTRACTGTGVSKEAQEVSGKARAVPVINFYRARAGNKVDIYKKLN